MDIDNIYLLDGAVEAAEERFGGKIHMLSRLLRERIPVPKGYYFTVNPSLDDQLSEPAKQFLGLYHTRLVGSSQMKCIVRSSSSVENKIEHQFAGLFKSQKNVSSFDDLLKAIRECYASRR